jgi:L-lysine 2,3-aminomutase
MKELVHKLVKNRCVHITCSQCDLSEGLSHFALLWAKGIEIIESLIDIPADLLYQRM